QSNDAESTATANVSFNGTSTLGQTQTGADPSLGLQSAWGGQSIVNVQSATAAAETSQLRPVNLNEVFGAPIVSVKQRNKVSADADAEVTAHVIQGIEQD